MFYTSRRIKAEEAYDWGLVDVLVPSDELRDAAIGLATEIAECSPISIIETRKTMRGDLAERVKAATDHELAICLLYTSPSPRDMPRSRMPSSA